MTAARIIAANPPRALAAARAVAAANEGVVCPDGRKIRRRVDQQLPHRIGNLKRPQPLGQRF